MSKYTDEFFEGKRSWSHIKDRVLGSYIPAYTAKLATRGQRLLFIDAFAGPGRFEKGEAGSPLLICSAAEKFAHGRYDALFINKDKKHHDLLDSILREGGYYPQAKAIWGDSNEWLRELIPVLKEPNSIFLYMDPYGLGIPFDTLLPFLNRSKNLSTEIMVNLCAPILHRLAGREATELDEGTQEQRHQKLTSILGGDYWKEALLTEGMSAKRREEIIVKGYMARLSENGYLQYTGYCPIQATRDGRTKYYMIFGSPHPDAMILLNDQMLKSFEEFMTQADNADTMFADLSWKDWRDTREIKQIALEYIKRHAGQTREKIWIAIVRDHFMRFNSSEYKRVTKELLNTGLINSPTPRHSLKLLNDECQLYPA
jgi:three-Cys-motif partner protein